MYVRTTEIVRVCHRDTLLCVWIITDMQEFGKKHEIWFESDPYGSFWAHIQPESIPQGLGSLWDASRALKPPGKFKNLGFRGLGEILPIPPYFPGLGNSSLSNAVRCREAEGRLHWF